MHYNILSMCLMDIPTFLSNLLLHHLHTRYEFKKIYFPIRRFIWYVDLSIELCNGLDLLWQEECLTYGHLFIITYYKSKSRQHNYPHLITGWKYLHVLKLSIEGVVKCPNGTSYLGKKSKIKGPHSEYVKGRKSAKQK